MRTFYELYRSNGCFQSVQCHLDNTVFYRETYTISKFIYKGSVTIVFPKQFKLSEVTVNTADT